MFVVLNLSDWIDGRLVHWLKKNSDFEALLNNLQIWNYMLHVIPRNDRSHSATNTR